MSEPTKKTNPAFGRREIIVLVCLVVFFGLVWLAMPRPSGGMSPANPCINNLRQIEAAANQFALEHHLTNGDAINYPSDLTAYIRLNSADKIPPCPLGGSYHISKIGETPTCSLGTNVVPAHVLP